MDLDNLVYSVATNKAFDDAVISVLKSVEQKGWTVFQVHDLKERLAAKGFIQKPVKIVEICSGKYANQFLNKNRFVSLCLPCRISIFEDKGNVIIAGMNPLVVSDFFAEIGKDEAAAAEREIKEIVDNAR